MKIFDPRIIIPGLGLVTFGYMALWIAALMFAPD
jgi:hypothetical protein